MSNKKNIPKGSKIEFKIENYLENNLGLVEPGLQLIKRQYKVYYKKVKYVGAIDLYCQGTDGASVIVELKSQELGARDLGQIMAYYAVCQMKADLYKLPPPRSYCIGLSVGPQYKLGLQILHGGEDINLTTQTYSVLPGTSALDKEFVVELHNYNIEDDGVLRIKR